MLKTLGGDRLGSGNKMKVELHNYERSTHNLSDVFRSTMAPGVLVPFFKRICTNGDTWTIDLNELVKTMPAIGPCFGAYKLQADVFEIPIRLYQGILHNNWNKIGMDMSKVKLPKIQLQSCSIPYGSQTFNNYTTYQISSSSLLAYTGLRGIGNGNLQDQKIEVVERETQCVPILAYYDIFKCYYANKQEKNAYVIDTDAVEGTNGHVNTVFYIPPTWQNGEYEPNENAMGYRIDTEDIQLSTTEQAQYGTNRLCRCGSLVNGDYAPLKKGTILKIVTENEIITKGGYAPIIYAEDMNQTPPTAAFISTDDVTLCKQTIRDNVITVEITSGWPTSTNYRIKGFAYNPAISINGQLKLSAFNLDNIDEMRRQIFRETALNTTFYINQTNLMPYKVNWDTALTPADEPQTHFGKHKFPMVGLCVKTYQSDMYNNWLSSDWIDGLNGINQITSIDTSNGSFTIDALQLAHKVYNMLNRIAVSGGTYSDWQEAVYGEDATKMAESPVYCGGMSGIIAFEEIVSTADTETAAAGDQPLGSLAGKGVLTDVKGGHIEIHIKEPSYIMGIVSITPLLDYCQGNDFDITELDSINDLHKPAMDQIGFQNLMLEQMAWWGCSKRSDGTMRSDGVGKQPAWLNYMTATNRVYGDFAEKNKLGFMVLTRDYEPGDGTIQRDTEVQSVPVTDVTTYINPTKFNYMFADTRLEAQNFWVQIGINAIARRKMSAKVMPNL